MIYKTLYLKGNPNAEYQKRNSVWYKRAIGSKEAWYKVDQKGSNMLNNAYKSKSFIYFYSNVALFGGVVITSVLGYLAYRKLSKRTIQ
jgi:hypothetical protein